MKTLFNLMIIISLIIAALSITLQVNAETIIHQTYPGTTFRDYSKPSFVVRGNEGYQTYPGTTFRDYSQPGITIERTYDPFQPMGGTLPRLNPPAYLAPAPWVNIPRIPLPGER